MVRWGIISPGVHMDTKIVPAMNSVKDTEIVAVFSRSQERAEDFASRHAIPGAFDSIQEFGKQEMDAVFVASPNGSHAEYTTIMAESGKHVLCEKPMSIDLESAESMIRSCDNAQVKLGIAFNLRAHPAHQRMKSLISEGKLGPIVYVNGQWAFGSHGADHPPQRTGLRSWWHEPEVIGGADSLMATGIHVIDLICDVLSDKVVEVTALSNGQTLNAPLDTLASVCCKFSKGTIANIVCGRIIPDSKNDLTVYGRDGFVQGNDTVSEKLQGKLIVGTTDENSTNEFPTEPLGNYAREIDNFNQAVTRGADILASGQAGYHSLEVTLAAIQSVWTGRTIQI